jgi:TonB family protein
MKNKIVLTTFLSILLAALSISAQTKAKDFSGDWTLDVNKSKFSNGMQIESMTLKVSQTEKELKVENMTKRGQTDMRAGGGGRRGGNGGAITTNYTLDGKETSSDVGTAMSGKETRKAIVTSDGKLSLTATRTFNDGTGELVIKTNETWELDDAGATLKVTRYMETPRGATNSEMYFTKANSSSAIVSQGEIPGIPANMSNQSPNTVSGGVLNGKAISFPKPAYPAAAKAVRASGAVNVQVTVDEQGNIISASAVSGHPLLRAAAEDAARGAKFSPTLLQGVPVKITGIIVYNFVP